MQPEAGPTSTNIATPHTPASRSFPCRKSTPACHGTKQSKQEQQGRFQGAPCPAGGKDLPSHTTMGWSEGGGLEEAHQH